MLSFISLTVTVLLFPAMMSKEIPPLAISFPAAICALAAVIFYPLILILLYRAIKSIRQTGGQTGWQWLYWGFLATPSLVWLVALLFWWYHREYTAT